MAELQQHIAQVGMRVAVVGIEPQLGFVLLRCFRNMPRLDQRVAQVVMGFRQFGIDFIAASYARWPPLHVPFVSGHCPSCNISWHSSD